jgi:SAM-dependent methyltransferase
VKELPLGFSRQAVLSFAMGDKQLDKEKYKITQTSSENKIPELTEVVARQICGFDDMEFLNDFLEVIPDDFSGNVLAIPVGEIESSYEKYGRMKNANIIVLDHSPERLSQMQNWAKKTDASHIKLKQFSANYLPFPDESFNLVLSVNGFHQFEDKDLAFQEIHRVLKSGGTFCACFYIRGESKQADLIVEHIERDTDMFCPPYYTEKDVECKLKSLYASGDIHLQKSILFLKCVK